MILFECSKCGEKLEAPQSLAGQSVECPQCGLHERVPTPSVVKESVEKSKKATNTFLITIWRNTPRPFKNAFLTTVGVLTAILLSYFVYAKVFASKTSSIEKYTTILAEYKLFPLGSESGIFRGRQLLGYAFVPDANFRNPSLSLWYDSNNILVGISGNWFGNVFGAPAGRLEDDQSYNRSDIVWSGFEKLVKTTLIFAPDNFVKRSSGDIYGDIYYVKKDQGKWSIIITRIKTEITGSENHRMFIRAAGSEDYSIYDFTATAQAW